MSSERSTRPWLEADSVRDAVDELREYARSVDDHPAEAWYATQLEEILASHGGDS